MAPFPPPPHPIPTPTFSLLRPSLLRFFHFCHRPIVEIGSFFPLLLKISRCLLRRHSPVQVHPLSLGLTIHLCSSTHSPRAQARCPCPRFFRYCTLEIVHWFHSPALAVRSPLFPYLRPLVLTFPIPLGYPFSPPPLL